MPRMTGKHAVMQQLVSDGVHYIFGNPGTTEQPFIDVLQDYPQIEFILALHEGVAVCMADAYARLTRKPAFVQLHIAPGLGRGFVVMSFGLPRMPQARPRTVKRPGCLHWHGWQRINKGKE